MNDLNKLNPEFHYRMIEPMKIRFKLMSEEATRPLCMTSGAAGFDLTAARMDEPEVKTGKNLYRYHTDVAFEIPAGFVGLVFPRSSVVKTGAILGNCVGVIDSDYRGEISFVFYSTFNAPYKVGERIGQIVIVPIPYVELVEADELSETVRGSGGYGSTGK